jgi:hypothetical protein
MAAPTATHMAATAAPTAAMATASAAMLRQCRPGTCQDQSQRAHRK